MNTITTEQAKKVILNNDGKIFGVSFIKKDGTHRNMTARLSVTKGVKGVGYNFDLSSFNLITAFDMRKKAFRMINCNNLISLSSNKKKYVISD